MSPYRDPELDDVLQDEELRRLADDLRSARMAEPPLDDAFRSALRRQLMQKAWGNRGERGVPWWRKAFAPPALAWAGAAVGVLLIAAVVVFMSTQSQSGYEIDFQSPLADKNAVQLSQPILVAFNQPMDHKSTEAAVQITPATTVGFSWSSNTLAVQPTSGNLAPNTQYQVTIGPGAKTASGQQLAAPKTITFVTQPKTTPSPTLPSPTVTPNSLLAGVTRLAPIPQGDYYTPQWSADSSTVYFIGAGGALDSISAKGGAVKVLVTDGVSLPAISPTGDQLAYVRGGKIEIFNSTTGATTELTVSPAPTTLAWVKDRLYWGTRDGVYAQGSDGPAKLASVPGPNEATAVSSIAPDGADAVFQSANSLFLLDVETGKTAELGLVGAGTTFQGWSPDSSRVIYNGVIADMQGHTVATLPSGDASWSAQNEILLGSDTDIYQLRPDGSGLTKLADGTYHLPVWAPNSAAFVFLRGQALWAATAPAPPPQPAAVDQASAKVSDFMQARLKGDADKAGALLDASGKTAYGGGGPALVPSLDSGFKRFYILAVEPDPAGPNTVRVVVRLVFGQGKSEKSTSEETLTLQRQQSTDPFLIHGVSAGTLRDLGKGAEVVAVDVTPGTVKVTFDSDLMPETVTRGVTLLDSKGKQVGDAPTYANRVVTINGLELVPGADYKLVVLTTVQDVHGDGIASEYDLNLIGPGVSTDDGKRKKDGGNPSSSPSPASPSPAPATTS